MKNSKTFFTVTEVAKYLRLSPLTLYGYIRSGKLNAVKFGRYYRIEEKALNDFISKHEVRIPANDERNNK